MADTRIPIFNADGQTAYIDYRTETLNGDGRQVIVIGDPSSNNGVSVVQATDPDSNTEGLVVRDVNTSAIVSRLGQTLNVQFDPGHTLGSISSIGSSVAVYFDRANPNVTANAGTGTFQVFLPDTGHELGSIRGITNSINVYVGATGGTLSVSLKPGTIAVSLDPGYTLGKVDQGVASSIQAWLINNQGTASLFTASGSASGVSVSGNTIISPSASYNFKIYAFSVQTTAQVSLTTKFTNGAGTSPTEFWRPLITASGVTGAQGANLASKPGAPLFATGTNVTLALVLDSASLVHYSVSYTKESA